MDHVKARVEVNSPTSSSQTQRVDDRDTWDHVTCNPTSSVVTSRDMTEV